MNTLSNADSLKFLAPEWLMPLAIVKFDWGEDNPNNRIVHIRAVVDDSQVVSRYWSESKQWWIYEVKETYWYFLCAERGRAAFVGMDTQ